MAKKRNLIVLLILGICLLLITAGCGQSDSAGGGTKQIAIGTAGAGGAWYPIGATMADIINNSGLNGLPPFNAETDNIAFMFSGLATGVMHLVVNADSPIQSMADLKGKKVAVGPQGGGGLSCIEDALSQYGISFNDIKPTYVTFEEGITMLTDRHVDCAYVYAPMPVPAIKSLEASKKPFRILSMEDDMLADMLEKYTYYSPITIAKDAYGTDEEIKTVGTANIAICSKDLPVDMVYDLMKVFFAEANMEKIRASHPSARGLSLEAATMAPIPYHPGAEKFFKEIGLLD